MKTLFKNLAFVIPFLGTLLTSCENDVKEDVNIEKNDAVSQRIVGETDLLWNSSNGVNASNGVCYRNWINFNPTMNSTFQYIYNDAPIKILSDLSGFIPNKPGSNLITSQYHVDNDLDYNENDPINYPRYNGEPDVDENGQNDFVMSSNQTAPSMTLFTLGHGNRFYGFYPGFAISAYGGYNNSPVRFNIRNFTRIHENADTTLREVGLIFDHWPGIQNNSSGSYDNPGWWSFKEKYTLGDFDEIEAQFKARLVNFYDNVSTDENQRCISVDLRIAYINSSNEIIRKDLLGVVIHTNYSYDLNGNPNDEIYWQGFNGTNLETIDSVPSKRIMLIGERIKLRPLQVADNSYPAYPSSPNYPEIKMINNIVGDTGPYTNDIKINFKRLIQQYLSPPNHEGVQYSIDDAVIVGFDIYSTTKGYDIEFDIKNIRLKGKNF
jgi:hypothetical protein